MNGGSKQLVTSASENVEQMCPLISDDEHILRTVQHEDLGQDQTLCTRCSLLCIKRTSCR